MAGKNVSRRPATYGDRNTPMRRPKESSSGSVLSLLHRLESLNFDYTDDQILPKCLEMFNNITQSDDATVTVFRQFNNSCLMDGALSRKLAVFLTYLIASGNDIFGKLLPLLQENFEVRDVLKGTGKFQNAMSLHGEIYNAILVGENEGIGVLAAPLLGYMKLALASNAKSDVLQMLQQLVINGKKLEVQGEREYQELLSTCRKLLVTLDGHVWLRVCYLLALDIAEKKFPVPRGPVRDFYIAELGDDYLKLECRAFGVPFVPSSKPISIANGCSAAPSNSVKNDFDKLAVKVNSINVSAEEKKPLPGVLPDAKYVRERMRARGLLPGPNDKSKSNFTSRIEKDDDFYGLQLPRSKSVSDDMKQALEAPLPGDDWE